MTFTTEHDRPSRFALIGRDLFLSGAVTSHGGNLSEGDGRDIWISRRGSMLGRMGADDVVRTRWDACEFDEHCSRELVVHRAIYHAVGPGAIVHAHTVHTIFRSLVEDAIEPVDSEARHILGARVPVLDPAEKIGSSEAASMLAEAFASGAVVAVLRSHGPFAVGATLEEAFYRISALEASCKLLDLHDSTGRTLL